MQVVVQLSFLQPDFMQPPFKKNKEKVDMPHRQPYDETFSTSSFIKASTTELSSNRDLFRQGDYNNQDMVNQMNEKLSTFQDVRNFGSTYYDLVSVNGNQECGGHQFPYSMNDMDHCEVYRSFLAYGQPLESDRIEHIHDTIQSIHADRIGRNEMPTNKVRDERSSNQIFVAKYGPLYTE